MRLKNVLGLMLNRFDCPGYEPLAIGFLNPPGQAHLGSIVEDNVPSVIRTLGIVAFVVDEQAEGVGLGGVTHGFWFRV